jgi:hypothetical protein
MIVGSYKPTIIVVKKLATSFFKNSLSVIFVEKSTLSVEKNCFSLFMNSYSLGISNIELLSNYFKKLLHCYFASENYLFCNNLYN